MSRFLADRAYDYFDLGDESDQERAESSEDEIDIILHGTQEQRRRLRHAHDKEQQQKFKGQPGQSQSHSQHQQDKQDSSSEDEFEREMNAELEKTVHMLEKSRGSRGEKKTPDQLSASSTALPAGTSETGNSATKRKPFYDNAYFDSDDDENYEGEGTARVLRQHAKPSNDDLLYDPDMDDDDQKWVDQQRQHGNNSQPTGNKKRSGKKSKQTAPKSDAVLDCPACMTTLCLDCQRHDIYPNQYRAMFVMNCKINTSELLSVPEQAAKKKKQKKSKDTKAESEEASGSNDQQGSVSKDKFHPVMCEECDTVVGVIDMDEVYHFFNVLTSRA